jgi:hypothetical protein
MPRKKSAKGWTDPDDAPELTEAMLDHADIYDGDKLIMRGHTPAKKVKQQRAPAGKSARTFD